MATPRRGATAAALLAALLTILTALVAVQNTASAQGAADPLFGAPAVGTCKNYTLDAAPKAAENSDPVDCATSHTAKVFAVELLPDSLDWNSPELDLFKYALKKCYPAWYETLGGTDKLRSMSAYTYFFFYPTKAQRENGARWIRCDVALYGATKLVPLSVDTSPMLPSAPLPDSVARCLATDNLYITTCARSHRFRATGAKTVDQDDFPGHRKLLRIARNRCPDLTTGTWYATWPGRLSWKNGQHTITCYSKTNN